MIGYVTLGTNDLPRAARFYDALLAEFGAERDTVEPRYIAWAAAPGAPMLLLIEPYDQRPATVGNGVMVALLARSREHVDAVHRKALELGASDEGAPGPRVEHFYGAYFRDPDGNKLAVYVIDEGRPDDTGGDLQPR